MILFPNTRRAILPDLLLLALLAALSLFFYHKTIAWWPSHIHAWTQGDRYALAVKFADTGLNLFKPRTFNLQTREGITAVDLPVHDYAVGVLMKLSGSREPGIFRLYTLLLSITGIWFLFRLSREATGSVLKSLGIAVFVFTCPVIVYYQAGFIPSATSFSALLAGYYFYFRYQNGLKTGDFYWAIGLMTLAALSRSPFNIFLFATLLQQGLHWIRYKKVDRKEALAYASAYGLILLANLYKIWLAKVYGTQFLGKLLPADNLEAFRQILASVLERWTFQVFTTGHYVLLALALAFLLVRSLRGRTDSLTRQITLQSVLALSGGALYFVLMARQYVDHEYYFMDSLYPGIILMLVAGMACIPFETRFTQIAVAASMALCLGKGILDSQKVQQTKYSDQLSEAAETTRKNFIGSGAFLDSLGIPRDARMLVIDAWSSNIPLIQMNRMGYTLLSTSPAALADGLALNYDFVVVQDLYFPSEVVSNFPEILQRLERVGGNGRITVLKNRATPGTMTVTEALGLEHIRRIDTLDFEREAADGWSNIRPVTERFFSPTRAGRLEKSEEFGPTLEMNLPEKCGRLLFEGRYYAGETGRKFQVIATLENAGHLEFYGGYAFRIDSAGAWRSFHAMYLLPDTPAGQSKLKGYLWNPEGAEMYLDDLKVTLF